MFRSLVGFISLTLAIKFIELCADVEEIKNIYILAIIVFRVFAISLIVCVRYTFEVTLLLCVPYSNQALAIDINRGESDNTLWNLSL